MITVTPTCPICDEEITVKIKIITDEEGDPTIPYGIHRYATYEDYKLVPTEPDSDVDHTNCIEHLEANSVYYNNSQPSLLNKLLDKAMDLALPIFYEKPERVDDRI